MKSIWVQLNSFKHQYTNSIKKTISSTPLVDSSLDGLTRTIYTSPANLQMTTGTFPKTTSSV